MWDGIQAEKDRLKAEIYDMKRSRSALILNVGILDNHIANAEARLEELSKEDGN
jgi:hydroxyethylthiazole kinase-like sugar kinase family protein